MTREETAHPRQGIKVVTAERRRAVAEERARVPGPGEAFPLPLQQMRLAAKDTEGGAERAYAYGPPGEKRSSRAGRLNMAGVCALARRLMARERARALGRRPLDLRAWALEQEARGWVEGRTTGRERAPVTSRSKRTALTETQWGEEHATG